MPTCSVQTHTDMRSCERRYRCSAFTFTELVVAVVIVSLFVLLAMTNLGGLLGKNSFNAQVHEFISTMQMAVNAAAESDRRYEVIIDIAEQSYTLRQITTADLTDVLEEEIIVQNDFSDKCRVSYVVFDDLDYTNEGRAKFRAGRSGWQYGGKIVLLGGGEKAYSVIVNRLSGIITLKDGDVEFMLPKSKDELPF